MVLLGGLLGFALLVTAHAAREQRATTTALSEARDMLELRVGERTGELQRANESLGREVLVRRAAEESLRELSGRLLQLQGEERRRIARELHDSAAQTLTACAISVEKARLLARAGRSAEVDDALIDAQTSIEAATSEIRTISHLLHPPVLDDFGLADALEWYAEGFSSRSQIKVDVKVPRGLGRLPRDIELTLFRIVQEGLTNVHRHSGSGCARVALIRDGQAIRLEIQDSGRGIPSDVLQAVDGRLPRLGVGIAGMRERVRQLGGQIEISSNGGGTLIRTVLPLGTPAPPCSVGVQAD
jgi:signal transduction histidine kinase